MNFNKSFLQEARAEIDVSKSVFSEPCKSQFKLTQLLYDVKVPVKLLICFKSPKDGQTYFALENIKGCPVAPTTKSVQTQTTYQDDETISKFLQENDSSTISIRYLEKARAILCVVEVIEQELIAPEGRELYWLNFNQAQQYLQMTDREDFQVLLLKV